MRHSITVLGMLLVGSAVAGAAPVVVQPDEAASKDGFIYGFGPVANTPFGSTDYLGVANAVLGPNAHVVRTNIQFNLAPTGLTAADVETAKLRLYVQTGAGTPFGSVALDPNASLGRTVTANVHRVTGNWLEASASWNNPPAVNETPVASFLIDGIDEFVEVDITSLVESWLTDPSANFGVQLRQAGSPSAVAAVFASAGAIDPETGLAAPERRPAVVISLVPEPATLGLLGAASVLMLRRRK